MKVKFLPQDVELEIGDNQSVLDLARENGIEIKSVCNGMPSCAECRVKVVEGEHNMLPPSNKELGLIGTGHFLDQRRLSCQMLCFGDIVVDLSEQVEKAKDWQKRPQGSASKDLEEESYAVSGNLIDDDLDLLKEVDAQITDKDLTRPEGGKDFYKGLKSAGDQGQKKDRPQGKGGGGKKRRGGRNRNRNKNKSGTSSRKD